MGVEQFRHDEYTCDRYLCDFKEKVEPGKPPSALSSVTIIPPGEGKTPSVKVLCRGCMEQFWSYMRNQPGGPGGDR